MELYESKPARDYPDRAPLHLNEPIQKGPMSDLHSPDLKPIVTAVVTEVLDQLHGRTAHDCIEPHLTPPEIAKAMRVDPTTVLGWIR